MSHRSEFQAAVSELSRSGSILIMTHRRPDGDALGSSFGMREFFRRRCCLADVFLPEEMPHRHSKLFSGALTSLTPAEVAAYDRVLLLDCAHTSRLGTPEGVDIEFLRKLDFINVDHHSSNNMEAKWNLVDGSASSASLIAAALALEIDAEKVTPEAATAFLSGMMTDTGCFRFSNTSPDTMRMAAALLEHGADLETISNALFFSKPFPQVCFENELISTQLRMKCDGKFAYALIPPELLEKYNFSLKEDEGLIDLLREIDGVVVAMLLHRGDDGVKVSLRSKLREFPVKPLAQSLGGGGHDLAAGATLDFSVDAEKLMVAKVSELLGYGEK